MSDTIKSFRGEFSFLSNFTKLEKPLRYKGICYPTVEHFYQAMKTTDLDKRVEISQHPSKGLKAFCRSFELREDWEDLRDKVMLVGLRYKFSDKNPNLRDKLKATGATFIEEGNYWNDTYWGVCLKTGKGDNTLGKMLMKIREDL